MVLFVCAGNTCRSPMAAAICASLGVEAESAGLSAQEGRPASINAVWAMESRGLHIESHRARAVRADMVEKAERVVTMSPLYVQALRALFPLHAHKITCFQPPIADPYGQDILAYREAADEMERQLRAMTTAWKAL